MKATLYILILVLIGVFMACLVGFDIIADILREVMR